MKKHLDWKRIGASILFSPYLLYLGFRAYYQLYKETTDYIFEHLRDFYYHNGEGEK